MTSSSARASLDARSTETFPHLDTAYLLSHLLPASASRFGDRPAVRCLGEELSYVEFDQRVGQLAAALVEAGVERGDRVGLHVHKSLESIVGIHGILRAGAAYVPLDPLAPPALLHTIVNDCGIEVLVTHDLRRSTAAIIAEDCDLTHVVGLSEPLAHTPTTSWDQVGARTPIDPVPVLADDLAYVMYTSGSTGEPKGIMHTHRSGMAFTRLSAAHFALNHHDRLANFAPLHFDISLLEMFTGPAVGACVVILTEPYLRMPASLAAHLADEQCTVTYTVPSTYQQLLQRGGLEGHDFSSLRLVLFGGELFPPARAAELMQHTPNATLVNVYGPAEVNACTLYFFDTTPDPDVQIPIGVAWGDTETRVVGPDGRPVQDGATGELVVRTATMMQGYWNRPDLDAASFDQAIAPGGRTERWYRTGDLVDRADDGTLTFLGRRDHQVKVRGHRLELESVEAVLGDIPKIEQAVVGLRPGVTNGDDELVAAVIAAPEVDIDSGEVRRLLAEHLPTYAVPAEILVVTEMPRTPSGKIDRRSVRDNLKSSSGLDDQARTESSGETP